MTKCYFNFCNNDADTQVVTGIKLIDSAKEPVYNYVCQYHILYTNWHPIVYQYSHKKDIIGLNK